MVQEVNIVEWLKYWFYNEEEIDLKELALQAQINNKASTSDLNTTNSNVTALQSAIVSLDSRIDSLESIKAIEVVATLPNASADTMNRLYIISENSKINVYYTEENSGSYSWHKMDSDILDELSISWTDVTGKPFTSVDTALNTTSTNPVQNKIINSALSGKAPTSHASTATTYGVGTSSNYGHNKVINNLTTSSYADGNSLSAYQGYLLKRLIDSLENDLTDLEDEVYAIDSTTISYSPNPSDWGEASQVATNISNALTVLKQMQNLKQDKGDCVTSVQLVPYSTNPDGVIRLYFGDEQ